VAAPIKANDFKGNLAEFLKDYSYQPTLTPRLDGLSGIEFTQQLMNEIVLWKVNRFVALDSNLLRSIESVGRLNPGEHRQAESLLASLLEVDGIDPDGIDSPSFSEPRRFPNHRPARLSGRLRCQVSSSHSKSLVQESGAVFQVPR
jgi:hypothetical protein